MNKDQASKFVEVVSKWLRGTKKPEDNEPPQILTIS